MSRPMTTVGNASAVLSSSSTARRPRSRLHPRAKPSGMPIRQERIVAASAILRETAAIPKTSPVRALPANGQKLNPYATPTHSVRLLAHCRSVVPSGSTAARGGGPV